MTQEKIEQAIVDFITVHSRHPRFVLMDKESYEAFSESFYPTVRSGPHSAYSPLKAINTVSCAVDILSVDNKTNFFEVVG